MPAVALQAHYDGERIVLDEPFDLHPDAPLKITVLSPALESEADTEEACFCAIASGDAFVFLADRAEDIYTLEDGEPFHDAV